METLTKSTSEILGDAPARDVLLEIFADLKNNIDLMYRLKDRWKLPAVRRAWSNPEQRRQIIAALEQLRDELDKVVEGEK